MNSHDTLEETQRVFRMKAPNATYSDDEWYGEFVMASIFVSHSSKDNAAASDLARRLEERG